MRSVFRILILSIAGLLLLTACAWPAGPRADGGPLSTTTPLAIEAVLIPEAEIETSPTPILDSLPPSSTPEPSAATTSEAEPTAGQPYWNQQIARLVSPDEKWTAEAYGQLYSSLRVVDGEGSVVWEEQDYFNGRQAAYFPYRWSPESRYLYFSIRMRAEGYAPFNDGVGLRQLDLRSGEALEILPVGDLDPASCCPNWSSFSLSPDGTWLAYIKQDGRRLLLVLRNTATQREKRLWLAGYSNAGSFVWSPGQDWLAFAMTSGTYWEETLFSLMRVRVNDLTRRMIVEEDERYLDPVEWPDPAQIVIRQRNVGDYTYNIFSGALTPDRPATPVP